MKKQNHRYRFVSLIGLIAVSGVISLSFAIKVSSKLQSRSVPTYAVVGVIGQASQNTNSALQTKPETTGGAASYYLNSSNTSSPNTKTLVRFSSPEAQQEFINQNNLEMSELNSVDKIGLYGVNNSTKLKITKGAEVFANRRYQALLTPTDNYFTQQWYLNKIGAPNTWNNTTGSSSVVVAIIDTGFALNHQDLDNKWTINSGESGPTNNEGSAPNCTSRSLALDKSCNNIDDDADGYTDNHRGWDFVTDTNSVQAGEQSPAASKAYHGTFVSGIVSAETNNNQGISGVSWSSKLLPVQALSDNGSGDTLSVALAINYATIHGAKIINLSLGTDGDDPIVADQIQQAISSGVTVVAAAGNDGTSQLSYPANYPGVIAVGATDSSDNIASFSSYGANISLVAPGTSSICSTSWKVSQPNDFYDCNHSGTSFSSPMVAGAAALLLAQNPTLTPSQIKSALTSTATKVAGMGGQSFTSQYGYGRLDIYNALKSVSLAAPEGSAINTHSVSLLATNGVYKPQMNTSCASYYTSSVCRIRAINTATNQVVELTDLDSLSATINHYWNASTVGLSIGTWIVQMQTEVSGKYSMVREESLVVSP